MHRQKAHGTARFPSRYTLTRYNTRADSGRRRISRKTISAASHALAISKPVIIMSIRVHIHKYVYTYINTRVCKSSCAARECAFFLLLRLEQTFDPGARENRVGYIFFFFLSAPRALLWPVYVPLQRFGDSVTPGRTSKRVREREPKVF